VTVQIPKIEHPKELRRAADGSLRHPKVSFTLDDSYFKLLM